MTYKLEELSKEEAEQITAELTAVLDKWNVEMGVSSSINIMKRVEEGVLSPLQPDGDSNNIKEETDTTTEEGS